MSKDWRGYEKVGKPFNQTYPLRFNGDTGVVIDYLERRGLDSELAYLNGWYPSRNAGDDLSRLVIPCVASQGVYWQARDMTGNGYLRYQSPRGCSRGDALVIVHPQGKPVGYAILEGPLDALAAAGAGWEGIGLMGINPPESTLEAAVLAAKGPRIALVSDRDSLPSFLKLAPRFPGAMVINPYPYKDLAEVPPADRAKLLDG